MQVLRIRYVRPVARIEYDCNTDTITEQKVKVQMKHVYAHAQYQLL